VVPETNESKSAGTKLPSNPVGSPNEPVAKGSMELTPRYEFDSVHNVANALMWQSSVESSVVSALCTPISLSDVSRQLFASSPFSNHTQTMASSLHYAATSLSSSNPQTHAGATVIDEAASSAHSSRLKPSVPVTLASTLSARFHGPRSAQPPREGIRRYATSPPRTSPVL
jgi:hypothetical protein